MRTDEREKANAQKSLHREQPKPINKEGYQLEADLKDFPPQEFYLNSPFYQDLKK